MEQKNKKSALESARSCNVNSHKRCPNGCQYYFSLFSNCLYYELVFTHALSPHLEVGMLLYKICSSL